MRKISNVILTCVCVFSAISCGEELLEKENKNNQTTESYYKTADEIVTAVNGVYAMLQSNPLGGREWYFLHDLRSDEMTAGGGHLEAHRRQILTGVHTPSNDIPLLVWSAFYRMILRANAVIKFAPDAVFQDEDLRARCIGEAKFLRGYAYFQLYGLFGAVPLYEDYATSLEGAKPRASLAEVKARIVSDFTDAISSLPASYSEVNLGRATNIAARAMLAKVYMFDGQYAEAKPLLEAVIDAGETAAGGTALVDEYFDNFTEEAEFNKESIWEIGYDASEGGYNWDGDGNDYGRNETWIRSQEYSAVGWRNLIPSQKMMEEYEDGDPRLEYSIYVAGDLYGDANNPTTVLNDGDIRGDAVMVDGVETKPSWRKYSTMYKATGAWDQNGINYRMLRYADMYLLLAECENEVGTPAKAVEYLNKTRTRPSVNMPEYPTAEYPTGTKDEIMRAIMHERMIELAAEEQRNFDILRWRKAGKLPSEPISYFVANKYELLPIPTRELDNNPNINQSDQNPGY